MQIALNSVRTLLFRVVYVGLGWMLSVLTARWLGPQGNGLFTLATIYGTIGTTLMSGGVAAVAYEISNKGSDARSAAANVGVLSLATGLVPALLAVATWPLLAAHGWWWLLPVALAQPAALLGAALVGVFLGTDDIRRLNYAYVGPWAATLLIFILMATLFGRTVQVALDSWALGQGVAAVYSLWLCRSHWAPLDFAAITFRRLNNLLTFGVQAGLANLVSFLNYRMDAIMVELFLGQRELGIYGVGVRVAEGLWFFSQAIMTAAYASIGSLSAEESARLTARGMRHSLFIIGVIAITLLLVADPLLRLLYTDTYRAAVVPFRWLVPGIACYGLASVLSAYYTNQRGHPHVPLAIAGLSTLLNLGACVFLIPALGLAGAAIASTLGYTVAIVAGVVAFQRSSRLPWHEILLINGGDLRDYRRLMQKLLTLVRPVLPAPSP
ncbi:MAG TPA: oligosaccharide flippase family protein [Dehalococcoidia bacterium]|nr:oligosaccharide flippase family protein [Dehalococcoidia bacterium]